MTRWRRWTLTLLLGCVGVGPWVPVRRRFRWRDTAGNPIASAPKGWSCDRRRLAAGATVADCTLAPPKDCTAVRFLDVSLTNYVTRAQSDTRSYRVGVGS